MEVHGRQPNDRRDVGSDLRKGDRARTREARKTVEGHSTARHEAAEELRRSAIEQETIGATVSGSRERGDVLDLSRAAQAPEASDNPKRQHKLEGLRREFENGTLNTPALIERAAERILAS